MMKNLRSHRSARPGCLVFLLMLLCSLTLPATAQRWHRHHEHPRAGSLAAQIGQVLADPKVSGAHWGISVTTLDGRPIYSLNDNQYFQPASNNKLFTTATALALLGPEYEAKTYLWASGTVTPGGHLQGSLRLVGAGDPSLSSRIYPYNVANDNQRLDAMPAAFTDFADAVAKSGIGTVNGGIVADDTFFPFQRYGPGWSWDDMLWDYGAPISALMVNDNAIYLTVQPGAQAGDPPQVTWDLPNHEYTLDTSALTTSAAGTESDFDVDRQPGGSVIRLYGQIPAGGKPKHLALATERPDANAADLLQQALQSRGIPVEGALRVNQRDNNDASSFRKAVDEPLVFKPRAEALAALQPAFPAGERLLATHTAPPLIDDITTTNKLSLNQHAELLLRMLGRAYGKDGSFTQGVRVVRQFLLSIGVAPGDFLFHDGSGLSNYDLVMPRATTTLLRYAAKQPWGELYKSSLPIGGADGTLEHRFVHTPLQGKLFAKTGTLSTVHSLSGYMTAASGRTLVFSVMTDTHAPGNADDRIAMDKILNMIAAAN